MDIPRLVAKLKKSRKFAARACFRADMHSIYPASRNLLTRIYGMTLNVALAEPAGVTKTYISVTLRERR